MTAKHISREFLPPEGTLPVNVTNLGIITQAKRNELLRDSIFILGLGDPVLGVTPFEAIAAGTAYINPVYKERKQLWENSDYHCTSQHTFAQQLGPPYTYDYSINNVESALAAVRRALTFNHSKGFEPYLPPEYTEHAVALRILESVSMRFVNHGGKACSLL